MLLHCFTWGNWGTRSHSEPHACCWRPLKWEMCVLPARFHVAQVWENRHSYKSNNTFFPYYLKNMADCFAVFQSFWEKRRGIAQRKCKWHKGCISRRGVLLDLRANKAIKTRKLKCHTLKGQFPITCAFVCHVRHNSDYLLSESEETGGRVYVSISGFSHFTKGRKLYFEISICMHLFLWDFYRKKIYI